MFSRHLSLVLALSLIYTASAESAFAQTAPGGAAPFAEEVRQNISRLGLGREARAIVKLRDNRKVAGYVGQVGADSFTLTDRGTGAPITVLYTEVQRISGGNRAAGVYFSLPEPKPKEPPKWLKGVAKGAEVVVGIGGIILLMSVF